MLRNIINSKININKIFNCYTKYASQHTRLYSKTTNLENVDSPDFKVYKPRRACMYIPGDDERKLAKISQLKADCIILDCEDGVSINRKVNIL